MNRFTILLFVALVTFFIVLWLKRPDVVSNIWLWLVGLAGPIIILYKRIKQEVEESDFFKKYFKRSDPNAAK